MKKSTAFGAVLCSAALAMGMAMPAFAAAGSAGVNDSTGDFKTVTSEGATTTSADTTIKLTGLDAEQISATVPVDITVAAPENGGEITPPTSSAYKITNNGSGKIYLASAKAVTLSDDFEAVATKTETDIPASGKPTSATAKGKFYLEVSGNGANAQALTTTDGVTIATSASDISLWTAGAKDSGSNTIALDLAGKVLPKAENANTFSTIPTDSETTFAKITYTVATIA